MDVYVVSNHPSVATTIAAGLERLGIHPRERLTLDDIQRRPFDSDRRSLLLVGFLDVLPEDLAALGQLCTMRGEGSKVVAIGPLTRPNAILQAIRSGAADFLDLNGDLVADLKFIIQRFQSVPGQQESTGKLFTVVSSVGGAGASFLAANLSTAIARVQGPCGLLDLKLRGGDLSTLLKATPRYTLMSLAEKFEQLDAAMFSQSLIKLDFGVHLLASPEPFSDYRKINLNVIQKVLHLARACCPNVVVDLEDFEHAEQVRALAESTQIIVLTRLDFVALARTKKCVEHLRRSKINPKQVSLVASRTGLPNELTIGAVEEVLGVKLDHSIPFDAAGVNSSMNLGVPLVLSKPDSKAAASVIRLAECLVGSAAKTETARNASLLGLPAKVCSLMSGMIPSKLAVNP